MWKLTIFYIYRAIVQKYLLEKSRICSQAKKERNYHVFYYLLAGANDHEKDVLHLLPPDKYHYLNQVMLQFYRKIQCVFQFFQWRYIFFFLQSGCYTLEAVDESYEFSRLKQSMEMVGFRADKQTKLFSVLSAVLLLGISSTFEIYSIAVAVMKLFLLSGNVEFMPKKSSYHHDESVVVKNPDVVRLISGLLKVTEETLLAALTSKRARVSGEMLVINYRLQEVL